MARRRTRSVPGANPASRSWSGPSCRGTLGRYSEGVRTRTYKDGVFQNESVGGPPQAESATAKLGRHATNSAPENFFDGAVDEVRLSATPHPDKWITLQYRSMTDAGLVNFGAEMTGNYALP